jgi:UDP-N-acetylmuramoyl-tripeptide--D-alanyl-D-alanine ligase
LASGSQNDFAEIAATVDAWRTLRFQWAALINDSYNSSPAALQAMTALLAATPGFRRRILAAGEMRELGETSAQLHREAGIYAAKTGAIDWVIGVEGQASELIEGAASAGILRDRLKFFSSSSDAAQFLQTELRAGDLLLVKGSRGVKMERIVEALLEQRGAPGTATEVSH